MYNQGTIEDSFDTTLTGRKALASVVCIFAAIGILHSAVGIYGVLSYDITQFVSEI